MNLHIFIFPLRGQGIVHVVFTVPLKFALAAFGAEVKRPPLIFKKVL
jgi:hypothetical protein